MVRRKKRVCRFFYSITPNVFEREKKTLDYKGKVTPITKSPSAPTHAQYLIVEWKKKDEFFLLRIESSWCEG